MSETKLKTFKYESEKEVLSAVLNPENNIEFVRIMFPDILGRKGKNLFFEKNDFCHFSATEKHYIACAVA